MIVLRNKNFSVENDKYKYKDSESERFSKEWRERHTGHPHVATALTLGGATGAGFGGYQLGKKLKSKSILKKSIKESKEGLEKAIRSTLGKIRSNGKIISAKDIEATLKDKATFGLENLKKKGNLDRITRHNMRAGKKSIAKAGRYGSAIAASAALLPGLALIAQQEEKRDRFLNNPKKVEVGYVKLKDKKKVNKPLAKEFSLASNRLPVSDEDLEKAKTDGVVQKRPDNGKWGIIAIQKKLWWSQSYDSRENAENALRAYHANN